MIAPHSDVCLPIDSKSVFISPRGKLCRWVPAGGPRGSWGFLYFEYVGPDFKSMDQGFTLSHYNVRLLRKAA